MQLQSIAYLISDLPIGWQLYVIAALAASLAVIVGVLVFVVPGLVREAITIGRAWLPSRKRYVTRAIANNAAHGIAHTDDEQRRRDFNSLRLVVRQRRVH